MRCEATKYLTKEDWEIVDFYGLVQDQLTNHTPMGAEGGRPVLAPRLEGWLAACGLYGVAKDGRPHLTEMARAIFDAVQGRSVEHRLHTRPIKSLLPLGEKTIGHLSSRQA